MNHHYREVGIEEPLQLASGGVDDAPAPLIEGEELGEDPEIDIEHLMRQRKMLGNLFCSLPSNVDGRW